MLGHTLARSRKTETKTTTRKRMSLVLEERGLTTDIAELKIRNKYMHDLIVEDLKLHQKKMQCRACVSNRKLLSTSDKVMLK